MKATLREREESLQFFVTVSSLIVFLSRFVPLLGLFVKRVLAAMLAELHKLQSIRVVLFVLFGVIIPLLAFCAGKSHLDSYFICHIAAPPYLDLTFPAKGNAGVPPSRMGTAGTHGGTQPRSMYHKDTTKKPSKEVASL